MKQKDRLNMNSQIPLLPKGKCWLLSYLSVEWDGKSIFFPRSPSHVHRIQIPIIMYGTRVRIIALGKNSWPKNWICTSKTPLCVSEMAAYPVSYCVAGKSSQLSLSVEEERVCCCLPLFRRTSWKSKLPSYLTPLSVLWTINILLLL